MVAMKRWAKKCGVVLLLGLGATPTFSQVQHSIEQGRPQIDNPGQAMRGVVDRTTGANQAAGEGEYLTGLEGGFAGTYEFMRAMDYNEQRGDNADSRMTYTTNDLMVLEIVSREIRPDGQAVVTATFKRVASRMEDERGPNSVDFDLSKPLPDNADELVGIDAMLPALKNATVTMLVNQDGNVTSVEGLPVVADMMPEGTEAPPLMFSMLNEAPFAILVSKVFNAEGGVERTRTQGETIAQTWSTLEEQELGPSGTIVITRGWTPRPAKGDGLEATGSYAMSLEAPPTPNEAAPKCNIAAYDGVGRLLWDEEGGLVYLNSTESHAMEWTLGTNTLRSTLESATTIQRVEK